MLKPTNQRCSDTMRTNDPIMSKFTSVKKNIAMKIQCLHNDNMVVCLTILGQNPPRQNPPWTKPPYQNPPGTKPPWTKPPRTKPPLDKTPPDKTPCTKPPGQNPLDKTP